MPSQIEVLARSRCKIRYYVMFIFPSISKILFTYSHMPYISLYIHYSYSLKSVLQTDFNNLYIVFVISNI
jgi:hypothetical protein